RGDKQRSPWARPAAIWTICTTTMALLWSLTGMRRTWSTTGGVTFIETTRSPGRESLPCVTAGSTSPSARARLQPRSAAFSGGGDGRASFVPAARAAPHNPGDLDRGHFSGAAGNAENVRDQGTQSKRAPSELGEGDVGVGEAGLVHRA